MAHRVGNTNSFGGPPPSTWTSRHEESWRDSVGGYSTVPAGRTLDVAAGILDRLGY
jgi:hypothetical protein